MKKILTLFGSNQANFPNLNIEFGNATGIQWDNGAGKTSLINQFVILHSTRLDYSTASSTDKTVSSRETFWLSEKWLDQNKNPKNLTAKEEKELRTSNLQAILSDSFNYNSDKSSFSFLGGLYLEDTDNTARIVVMFPEGSGITKFARWYFKISNPTVAREITEYLKSAVLDRKIRPDTVCQDLISSKFSADILDHGSDDSGVQIHNCRYLKKQSPYFLGYTSPDAHADFIIISADQKNNSVVNESLTNRVSKEITDDLKEKGEVDSFIGNLIRVHEIVSTIQTNKKIDILLLSNKRDSLNALDITQTKNDLIELKTIQHVFDLRENTIRIDLESRRKELEIDLEKAQTQCEEDNKRKHELHTKTTDLSGISDSIQTNLNASVEYHRKQKEILDKYSHINPGVLDDRLGQIKTTLTERYKALQSSNHQEELEKIKKDISTHSRKCEKTESDKRAKTNTLRELEKELKTKQNATPILVQDNISENLAIYSTFLNTIQLKQSEYTTEDILDAEALIDKIISSNNKILVLPSNKMDESITKLEKLRERNIEQISQEIKEFEMELQEISTEQDTFNSQLQSKKQSLAALEESLKDPQKELTTLKQDLALISQLFDDSYKFTPAYLNNDIVKYNANKLILNTNILPILEAFKEHPEKILPTYNQLIEIVKELHKTAQQEEITFTELASISIQSHDAIQIQIRTLDEDSSFEQRDKTTISHFLESYSADISNEDLTEILEDSRSLRILSDKIYSLYKDILEKTSQINTWCLSVNNDTNINYYPDFKELLPSILSETDVREKIDSLNRLAEQISISIEVTKDENETTGSRLYPNLANIEDFLLKTEKRAKTMIHDEFKKLVHIKTSSGHSFEIQQSSLITEHPHVTLFKHHLNVCIGVSETNSIDEDKIGPQFALATHSALEDFKQLLLTMLRKPGSGEHSTNQKDSDGYIRGYFDEILINAKLKETGNLSSGNAFPLSTALRSLILSGNSHFSSLLFLDEIGAVDSINRAIMIQEKYHMPVYLGNGEFDVIRTKLDIMNQASIIRLDGERKHFVNTVVWKNGDEYAIS